MSGVQQRGRWLVSLVALIAIFGMALHGPVQAAAQEDITSSFNVKDLDGYQRGVSRVWMGDFTALLSGVTASGTPDLNSLGLFMVGGSVAEFDSSDHAGSAIGTLVDEVGKALTADESGITLKETDGEQIGDQSKTFTGSISEQGMDGQLTMIVAQKGNLLYMGFGMGLGSDPSAAVSSLVKDMTENQPGDGDGTFNADGTSTGGLWDVFPANDADYLKGLKPMSDSDLADE